MHEAHFQPRAGLASLKALSAVRRFQPRAGLASLKGDRIERGTVQD